MKAQLRIARPVSSLQRAVAMYCNGLGLDLLAGFVVPSPTAEDLIVFYLPDLAEWQERCAAMLAAGFVEVPSFNPYWQRCGRTFEDPDRYRVVLQQSQWEWG